MAPPGRTTWGDPDTDPRNDKELMAAVQERDRAAFEVLYGRYNRLLVGWMARRVVSWTEIGVADDLTADTWMMVWGRAHQYRDTSGVPWKKWLFKIALYRLLARKQRDQRHAALSLDLAVHSTEHRRGEPVLVGDTIADETLLDGDAYALVWAVRAAVETLPRHQRTVVKMRWLYDQDIAVTARRLELAATVVRQRQHSAFAVLRPLLAAWTAPN